MTFTSGAAPAPATAPAAMFGVDSPRPSPCQANGGPPTGEVLNAEIIAGLLAIMPAGQVRDLVDILVGEIESRVANMIRAETGGELGAVMQEARDLKAACASFGLVELADLARRIEAAARDGDHGVAMAAIDDVGPGVARALRALLRIGGLAS